jgi:hypothetical protein
MKYNIFNNLKYVYSTQSDKDKKSLYLAFCLLCFSLALDLQHFMTFRWTLTIFGFRF